MGKIKGDTVILYEETQTGTLPTGEPIMKITPVTVENVLIGEPTTDEITTSVDLYGKVIRYMLGIPKGDTHDWTNKRVDWTDANGKTYKLQTFGFEIMGIEANIPLAWHKKVRCASYE